MSLLSLSELLHVHRPLVVVVVQVDLVRVAVVEEPPERELEEAVERLAVVQQLTVRLVGVGAARVAQLVGVHRVEVGRVGGVVDPRDVRRHLPPQPLFEVDAVQERVVLHLVGIFAEPRVLPGAQLQD